MDQQQSQQSQPAQQDFDIWEFVTCSKCQLCFSPDGISGPSVPFWITECGHVLCNSHLNADQSCPSCNAQKIELMPLQREDECSKMPPPFSDWFGSLPFKLDALAQAAKFQHERLAGAAHYYKARCEQYRAVLPRMKAEVAQAKALRKENEALRSENARLRGEWTDQQQQGQPQDDRYQQEPAPYVNSNGKRALIDSRLPTSSPRSIHTPVGPPRITLPPNHDPPPSLARLGANGQSQQQSSSRTMQPPGSSHFSQQYAYNPPQSSQMQLPNQQVLSYEQQAPVRQQIQQNERRLMPPPPTPIQSRQLGPVAQGRQVQRLATPRVPEQAQFNQNHARMQVPQSSHQGSQQSFSQSSGTGQFQSLGQATRRFVPPTTSNSNVVPGPSNTQRFVPSTPSGGPRRFMPQTPNVENGRSVAEAIRFAVRLRGRAAADRPRTPLRSHALSRVSINNAKRASLRKATGPKRRRRALHAFSSCAFAICDCAPPKLRSLAAQLVEEGMAPPPTTRGWTPDSLVALGPRMQHVPRVSAVADYERLGDIIKEYEESGVPLIIEDWQKRSDWPRDGLFGVDWLLEHADEKIAVRDCVTRRDKEIPFKEFVDKSRMIPEYTQEDEDERLYGKDAICPKEWKEWLMSSNLPDVLKPGSSEDVLEFLPEPERVETLMCYYGIGDTFTAAHKDLCASSGQNLMCFTERGGSAFWFMTRSFDAPHATSYFQKELGAELDHELYVATPDDFANAPFTVYITEQRTGDLVLVPRRSCHQVVNHGGITAKMSWSRMTVEGLSIAFHHELPIYRRVCRSETYRIKLLVYRTLLKYTADLEKQQEQLRASIQASAEPSHSALAKKTSVKDSGVSSFTPLSSHASSPLTPTSPLSGDDEADDLPTLAPEHEKLVARVRTLLSVYDKILKEEHHGDTQCEMRIHRSNSFRDSPIGSLAIDHGVPPIPIPAELYHDGLTCDFCGADIFQSFFECRRCVGPTTQDDSIIVCPGCYVEGRACGCSIMTPVQQFPMDVLFEAQHKAQRLLNFEGYGRNVVKPVALSHQAIDKLVKHPGIFAAACQLPRIRAGIHTKQRTLACRSWKDGTHRTSAAGALSCKKCHSSRCFRHILWTGYYVADAVNLYLQDDMHVKWHSHHTGGAKRLAAARPAVLKAEETGEPCDMSVSLVLHAEKFTSCRAMSERVKPGWYDDASYTESDEVGQAPASDYSVEGFSGAVLGESDYDVDDDTIEVIPNEAFARRGLSRKNDKVFIKISKKSIQTLQRQQARSHEPPKVPYILLNRLTSGERRKYYLKNLRPPGPLNQSVSESLAPERSTPTSRSRGITMRRRKGSSKKPPGIPASEVQNLRAPLVPEGIAEDSSSDDNVPLTRLKGSASRIKIGPPSKSARLQVKTIPKRHKSKPPARSQLRESLTITRDPFEEVDTARNGPATLDFSLAASPLTLADDDTFSLPTPRPSSVPQPPINTARVLSVNQAAYPAYDEVVQRLEKNEEDVKQYRQENEKLRAAVKTLEEEVTEINALRVELDQVKAEVTQLKLENLRLRQQPSSRPASNGNQLGIIDSRPGRHRTEPAVSPFYNVPHLAFNSQKAVITDPYTPSKKAKVASGIMRRIPALQAQPSQHNTPDDSSPDVLAISAPVNRKRRLDELYSTPVRQDDIDIELEATRTNSTTTQSTPSDTEPQYENTPVTPDENQNRILRRGKRRVGAKRRRCSEDVLTVTLPQTPRRTAVEEEDFSPDAAVTPHTPVRTKS